jgi:hypothetical protein
MNSEHIGEGNAAVESRPGSHRGGDHVTASHEPHEHFEAKVTVNGKSVVLHKRELTGLEIKEAAIAQNVKIELDFILQEELPNGHNRIVGDGDLIRARDHDRFTAIPNDDNS